MLEDDLCLRFPDSATSHSLAAIVADDYALKAEEQIDSAVTLYDTFDWRLYNKDLVLCRIGDELVVRRLSTGSCLESLTIAAPPGFVSELVDGPLKRRLASITGERRLLQVGAATIQTAPYRVLNADGKTVARLLDTQVRADTFDIAGYSALSTLPGAGAALVDSLVELAAVRGYAGQFRRLARKLGEAGLTACQWQDTFERILAAAGATGLRQPGKYSAKPDYQLKPGSRADEAIKAILRHTLAVMRENEDGIKADWDAEFLHDYRTAVRRTRSALSQVPGVFPPEITERWKEAFGLLGEHSNRLRDLDVYLLSEPDYRAMLPDAMADHIAPLFNYLRVQRRQALQEVIADLNSMPYAAMIEAWAAFLAEPVPDAPSAPNATLPIDEVARRRIDKRYRKVIKDGNEILDHTQDELLHALRIDCKKLRYLMEFFASLFPKKEIDKLIGQLRVLQDDLGIFNDLSVQQAYLLHIAEVLPANDAQSKKGLVAIGFLVDRLAREQQEMKPELAGIFAEFAAAPNRALFRQLFRTKRGVSGS